MTIFSNKHMMYSYKEAPEEWIHATGLQEIITDQWDSVLSTLALIG